jgi:hypothetical protein
LIFALSHRVDAKHDIDLRDGDTVEVGEAIF